MLRLPFGGGVQVQRQRMHRPGKLVAQGPVDELVPLDRWQAIETVGNHYKLEVRVGSRPCMHMALIDQLHVRGLAGGVQFFPYLAGDFHDDSALLF